MSERRKMIDQQHSSLSISRQCDLLNLHRSGLYYRPVGESEENLHLMRLMDEQYFKTPFYGVRRLTAWLRQQGYQVNPKRVSRLMKLINWQTVYRKPNTSKPGKGDKIYAYLLKGLKISRINQVWAMDITYVPMNKGFMYLCAIIDVHSRYVVNWSISNTMTAEWCSSVVKEALLVHGKPDIINTDQGSQFTSEEFIDILTSQGIKISMDGKGRAIDNIFIERLWRTIKYEHIYLHSYENGVDLYKGIKQFLHFYNKERVHQSLNYQTPEVLYKTKAA